MSCVTAGDEKPFFFYNQKKFLKYADRKGGDGSWSMKQRHRGMSEEKFYYYRIRIQEEILMYTLNVEKRDQAVKAKKLRRMGMVTGNIRVDKENTNLLFTIPLAEAKKFIKEKSRGGLVEVHYENETFTALVREILVNSMTGEIQEISLQSMEDGKTVTTFARVVLKNKSKLSTLVTIEVAEIPYKALAEDIVETAEIDITQYKPGEKVSVKDFAISENPKVELLMNQDTVVATVTKTAVS